MNNSFNTRLTIGLILLEVLLTVSYLLDVYFETPFWSAHIFLDLDSETSFPAWFSSTQLFLVGLILGVVAYYSKESKQLLYLLAVGFVFLSVDEATQIHEDIIPNLIKRIEFISDLFGRGTWMILYIGIAIGVLIGFYKQFHTLLIRFPKEAYIFIFGLVVFITGGVLVELIHFSYFKDMTSFQNGLQVALEEFLEMLGVTIVLYSIMTLLLSVREKAEVNAINNLQMKNPSKSVGIG